MSKDRKKETVEEIEIPEGIDVEIKGNTVCVRGLEGEVSRKIPNEIKISMKDNKVILSIDSRHRKERALLGTMRGHIQNMIKGVSEGITYKLKSFIHTFQ